MDEKENWRIRFPPSGDVSEDSDCSSSEDEYVPPKKIRDYALLSESSDDEAASQDISIDQGGESDQEARGSGEMSVSSVVEVEVCIGINIPRRKPVWRIVQESDPESARELPAWKGREYESETVRAPIEYFKYFFDSDVMHQIVAETNIYASQSDPSKQLNLTIPEMEKFLGCVVYMSIFRLPRTRMFWAVETKVNCVADVMTRDRWERIKKMLHFNNNDLLHGDSDVQQDRLFKIRPPLEMLKAKFKPLHQEQVLCIDEQMVPFTGRSGLKQYLPKKPHKWGYKIFMLCGTDGLVHNFEIYTGKIHPVSGYPDLGASANIVIKLTDNVENDVNHILCFDNWFTSIPLMSVLAKRKIYCIGTARQNRLLGCELESDKDLKNRGRGCYQEKTSCVEDTEIRVVKWYDKRSVTIASSFASAMPTSEVRRWDNVTKQHIMVTRPFMVDFYNRSMGGVDLLDALIAYYRIRIRSKKYYLRIFFHLVDLAIVNSWILYRRDCESLGVASNKQRDLLSFRSSVAESLCKLGKISTPLKRGRPLSTTPPRIRRIATPHPNNEVRTDATGHWPVVEAKRQRCRFPGCDSKPVIRCTKCGVYLCLNKAKNCFAWYHGVY
uniref:piggyBac transposable element-derived protein 2-like n=1 Tax=Styela clava TaxID=7725 RepID=UPI001939C46A|nr:piggyBac transposable element-derived protein 2-like [Styela clava]